LQTAKKRFSGAEVLAAILQDLDAEQQCSDVQCQTLREASDIAESDRRDVDIIILPPSTVDAVSDEESGDDDNLSPTSLPSDVAGPLLVQFRDDGECKTTAIWCFQSLPEH